MYMKDFGSQCYDYILKVMGVILRTEFRLPKASDTPQDIGGGSEVVGSGWRVGYLVGG